MYVRRSPPLIAVELNQINRFFQILNKINFFITKPILLHVRLKPVTDQQKLTF